MVAEMQAYSMEVRGSLLELVYVSKICQEILGVNGKCTIDKL